MIELLKRGAMLAVLSLCSIAPIANAQAFPDHFIKLVVPFPPGGATDVLGRLLAKKMSDILGQPIVVENHGGAGGTIGTDFASRQPADGYTIVLVSALAQGASRKLYPGIKYDPVKSFTPIGSMGALSYVLVVNPGLGITSLDGLIKAMKATPDKFNYASAGVGSAPHLAMELFLRAADVKATHVPYQGSAPALTGVVAGDTQFAIDNVAAVPLIKSGKLTRAGADGQDALGAPPRRADVHRGRTAAVRRDGDVGSARAGRRAGAHRRQAQRRAGARRQRSLAARITAGARHHARSGLGAAVRRRARERDGAPVEADRRREDSAMSAPGRSQARIAPERAARRVSPMSAKALW